MNPLAYEIDPTTLREAPLHPVELASWLDGRRTGAGADGRADEYAYRTDTGTAARLARRLELAESELSIALALAPDEQRRVLAGIRLAHVHQWQGREAVATEEFDRLLGQAREVLGERASFAHQHAGKCAYDFGRWDVAREHFATALAMRAGEPELAASSELAVDAAEACATAVRAAGQLHRLVPAAHRAAHPHVRPILAAHGRPPHAGVLIDLGLLATRPELDLAVLRGIHRYAADLDDALADLAAGGWLRLGADTVACSATTRRMMTDVLAAQARAAVQLWPAAQRALPVVAEFVAAARSSGPVFDALRSAVSPDAGLFHLLITLRQHRAESHEAAWRAAGLDAAGIRALDGPARARIEVDTDQRAAAAYRPAAQRRRVELLDALAALPGGEPDQ